MGRLAAVDRRMIAAATLAAVSIALASVGIARPLSSSPDATCTRGSSAGVRWMRASAPNERADLDRWCAGVGPPVRIDPVRESATVGARLAIVSWNTHVGGGDIDGFVADLRSGTLTGHAESDFVLLLQEVYRSGTDVPALADVAWASIERPGARPRVDVATAARRLGLWAIYVPSMRNGRPGTTAEDRGNAILSTRPLSDVTAIELPLERQRRVAIAASLSISAGGSPTPVRIVCTHFTNMVMHHLWLLSESGRLRQARALKAALPDAQALVIGGDFNAWFGFRDAAYREMARGMSRPDGEDRRPTFGPLRLDHLLFRLPAGWHTSLRRAARRYGSDHYPLIATVTRADENAR